MTPILFIGGYADGHRKVLKEGQTTVRVPVYRQPGDSGVDGSWPRRIGQVPEETMAMETYHRVTFPGGVAMINDALTQEEVTAMLMEGYRPGIALDVSGGDFKAAFDTREGQTALFNGGRPQWLVMKMPPE